MTDGASEVPWFEFRIHDTEVGFGVDARVLSRFLSDFSIAMRAIAGERLGVAEHRGPLSADERAIAAIRVTAVRPGSIAVQFAEPPALAQGDLMAPTATADEAIDDFISLCQSAVAGEAQETGTGRAYRAVAEVLRTAARIGTSATLTHQDRHGFKTEATFTLDREAGVPHEPPLPEIQQRTIIGHVYMVDVELGRQRLRVKLPDETDVTLDVHQELVGKIGETIDRIVELHVSEARVADRIVERVVGSYLLVPTPQRGSLAPPRTLLELARERGFLLGPPPDYGELASAVWETQDDIDRFQEYISTVRSKSA